VSPVGGELPPRIRRAQAAPEHNILQNPAITRGLQVFGGLRQAHIAPALSDGLQPIVITGDIREDPRTRIPMSFASEKDFVGDGVNPFFVDFINPPDHTRIVVLRRFHAFAQESSPATATYLYYNHPSTNILPSVSVLVAQPTTFGFGDGAQLFPPASAYAPLTDNRTRAGWRSVVTNGNAGAYLWRTPWFGATPPTYAEVLEDFNGLHGPRVILWPGSQISFGISDGTANAYFNMWWDEYPVS
jgi:hypothetical protein